MFSAFVGARIHAFFAEFGLLFGAGACVVAAIVLLSLPRVPIIDGIKRTLAYVLFGVAIGLVCWLGGFRHRGALDASADLRREIEAQKAIVVEKDRQARAAEEEAAAQRQRRADAEKRTADMQQAIDDFEHQEPRVETRTETKIVRVPGKTVVRDVCLPDGAFARGVQRLDDIARRAPKPAAAR